MTSRERAELFLLAAAETDALFGEALTSRIESTTNFGGEPVR